jgi:cytochrome b
MIHPGISHSPLGGAILWLMATNFSSFNHISGRYRLEDKKMSPEWTKLCYFQGTRIQKRTLMKVHQQNVNVTHTN